MPGVQVSPSKKLPTDSVDNFVDRRERRGNFEDKSTS